jgi:hypothetical protein
MKDRKPTTKITVSSTRDRNGGPEIPGLLPHDGLFMTVQSDSVLIIGDKARSKPTFCRPGLKEFQCNIKAANGRDPRPRPLSTIVTPRSGRGRRVPPGELPDVRATTWPRPTRPERILMSRALGSS